MHHGFFLRPPLPQPTPRHAPPRRKGEEPRSAGGADTEELKARLYAHLHNKRTLLFKGVQYRDKYKKILSNAGSFSVGHGSTNPGFLRNVRDGLPGFAEHNFKNIGVNVKPLDEQTTVTNEQKEAYHLAADLIAAVDPWFAKGEFQVQFALMDSADQYVRLHKDRDDITYQYALALGDFKGAKLRVWDGEGRLFEEFDNRDRIVKFDGRRAHEVVADGFYGKRFSVVWFKNYDARMTSADPIFEPPVLVDESESEHDAKRVRLA